MYIAVSGMAEAHHLHAGFLLQRVDELNEIHRMADGHHDVHRLLLRNRFHRLHQRTADLPDLRRPGRIRQGNVVERTVFQGQLPHSGGVGIDLTLMAVEGQKNVGARLRARVLHAGEILAEGHHLPLHKLHRRRIGIGAENGQDTPDSGMEIRIRNQHAE